MMAVLHNMTEVRLVDPATGREFARLPTVGQPFCFSPDGSQLVTYARGAGAFHVWDLRLIRGQLADLGLDWDLPPYPPAPSEIVKPLRVEVLPAEPLPPSRELDADAHFKRGLLLIQLRQYGQAGMEISKNITLNPSRPRWDELVRAYSRVIELHPTDGQAYDRRGAVYGCLGQWAEAAADFSQAIKLAPQNRGLLLSRGQALFYSGQREKAAEDYRKFSESNPHMANILARQFAKSPDPRFGYPSLAVDLARMATQQEPEKALSWNTLGIAYYRSGKWEEALAAIQKSIDLSKPGSAADWFFLAMIHWQLGNKAEAGKWYDQAVEWMDKNKPGTIEPTFRI
jgi:tetratricopeptide (TPR) repeat protein